MKELKQIDILDKAFNNAWLALVREPSIKDIPIIFDSQKMRLYFIEIYKHLYEKSSGDKGVMSHWFNHFNKAFNCTPREACQTESGLLKVKEYLESFKYK